MRAVRITEPGDADVLRPEDDVPDPEPGPDEVLVDVRAAAINRADLYQRRGHYPVPPGWPEEIPGLEMAGVAAAVGSRVQGVEPGDRVMALLGGGGYAERVAVHGDLLLPVPENLTLVEAAGVPEVFYTWARPRCSWPGPAGPGGYSARRRRRSSRESASWGSPWTWGSTTGAATSPRWSGRRPTARASR